MSHNEKQWCVWCVRKSVCMWVKTPHLIKCEMNVIWKKMLINLHTSMLSALSETRNHVISSHDCTINFVRVHGEGLRVEAYLQISFPEPRTATARFAGSGLDAVNLIVRVRMLAVVLFGQTVVARCLIRHDFEEKINSSWNKIYNNIRTSSKS